MKPLQRRISEANALLAPYAVPIQGRLGRVHPEPDDATRFPFQRDRDRIIHTQAFRRLKGKTQVFIAGEGDHYRTRLTHTMEVAQISRDIARTLSLNEDLAECIALAHDLGHPPFGHAGEFALDAWMKKHGSSFEHNTQSLRIVTILEGHSSLQLGLNLNREVLEGLQKHDETKSHTLEAQIVNLADEIAYTVHDGDDGLRAGLFSMDELATVPLIQSAHERAKKRQGELRSSLIHLIVTDLYGAFDEKDPRIGLSKTMSAEFSALRSFLAEKMYAHPRVLAAGKEGMSVVTSLCETFLIQPNEKILALKRKTGSALPEAVKDYVAGMTDAYAKDQLS